MEDIITQQHAHIISHDYGFCPVEPLKCERAIGARPNNTLFFCNTSNRIKVLIKYNEDELVEE